MRFERLLAGAALVIVGFCLSCSSSSNNNPGPVGPSGSSLRAPSDVQISFTSPDTIQIAWRYNTPGIVGFRVERSVGGPSSFALRDTVAQQLTSYIDSQVQSGQTYYYRVRAYTHDTQSDPSSAVWAKAATDLPPTPPHSPDPAASAFEIDPGPVTLHWTASSADSSAQLLYDVYFGSARNDMKELASGISASEFAIPTPVVKNASYFWQIVVRDPLGVMRIGPVWAFNTKVDREAVPAGWFFMGDTDSTSAFYNPGNPVHVDAFDIDRYEVTNQQFANFLNAGLRQHPPLLRTSGGQIYDPGGITLYGETREVAQGSDITYELTDSLFVPIPGRENFPAENVTWFGAQAFASYFNRRLPTEAEWEFAARGNDVASGQKTFTVHLAGGDTTITVGLGRLYPWGQQVDPHRANYLGSGDPFEGQGRVTTTPVGFYDGTSHGGYQTLDGSSPYLVQDMAGNIWEWCSDWYGPYTSPYAPPADGLYKVIRGGGWNKGALSTTTFNRSISDPNTADDAVGFRTVESTP